MTNYLFKIAEMLEVKMYYPFKVRMLDNSIKLLKFRQSGLSIFIDGSWVDAEGLIYKNLLNGNIEIVKEQVWFTKII